MVMSCGGLLLFVGLVLVSSSSCSCQPQVFNVGGDVGWVANSSVNYDEWAAGFTFHVHDKLVFKYEKGKESVLLVDEEGYNTCKKSRKIEKMKDGESVFEFDKPGNFYFISGRPSHCKEGQKMHVVVVSMDGTATSPPSPLAFTPPAYSEATKVAGVMGGVGLVVGFVVGFGWF